MFGRLYEKIDNVGEAIREVSRGLDKQTAENTRRFDAIETSIRELRETQIAAAKKNGNGNGAARAAATATKKAALPAGYGGAGAAIAYLLQHFLGG